MKNFLKESTSVFWFIVLYVFLLAIVAWPVIYLEIPWWGLLLVGLGLYFLNERLVSISSIILYILAFAKALDGPIGTWEIILFICAGLYVLFWAIFFIVSFRPFQSSKKYFVASTVIVISLALAIGFSIWHYSSDDLSTQKPSSKSSTSNNFVSSPPATPKPTSVPSPTPKPNKATSGTLFVIPRSERLAPFTVEAPKDADCFVRLHNSRSPSDDIGIYIRAGDTVETDVPLGKYQLYYATGQDWRGAGAKNGLVFGPDTQWYSSDDIFIFEISPLADEYIGYSLTLYSVYNGNLDTDEIDVSELPF